MKRMIFASLIIKGNSFKYVTSICIFGLKITISL